MSKNTEKLSLDGLDDLSDNINYVKGVLELLFCAIASEHPVEDIVLPVVMDAQGKMKEIEEKVNTLTAA